MFDRIRAWLSGSRRANSLVDGGRSAIATGDFSAAAAALGQLAGRDRELWLARLALAQGDVDGAGERLEQLAAELPADLEVQLVLRNCLLRRFDLAGVQRWMTGVRGRWPENVDVQSSPARALARVGELDEAVAEWRKLGERFSGHPLPKLGLADALLAAGEPTAALGLFEELTVAQPGLADAWISSGRVQLGLGDADAARICALRAIELAPRDPGAYDLLLRSLAEGGDTMAFAGYLASAPSEVVDAEFFRCEVLPFYYLSRKDWEGYEQSVAPFLRDQYSERQVVAATRYYQRRFDYEAILSLMDRHLPHFPYRIELHIAHLISLYKTGRVAELEQKQVAVRQVFGDSAYFVKLLSLPFSQFSTDFGALLQWVSASPERTRRHFPQLLDLVVASGDESKMSLLLDALQGKLDPLGELRLLAVRSQVSDIDRQARSAYQSVSWQAFADSLEDVERRRNGLATEVSGEAAGFWHSYRNSLSGFARVEMNSRESYHCAATVACELARRIRDGRPMSLIRLGDGEGNFLPYAQSLRPLQRQDQVHIQGILWGGEPLSDEESAQLGRALVQASVEADFIGAPPFWRLASDIFPGGELSLRDSNTRGNAAIVDLVESGQLDRRTWMLSTAISNDLFQWNLYRVIFRECESVSYVACHALEEALMSRFGLRVRQGIRITPENAYRQMFGKEEVTVQGRPYPEQYEEVLTRLDPEPGEVYLVGAGPQGKLICAELKRRGAIALDIGSTADYWSGFVTRHYNLAPTVFDPANSLVSGLPAELAIATQADNSVQPAWSGEFFDLDRPLPEGKARGQEVHKRLVVIGHPRCGSAFVAHALCLGGLDVGHETVAQDGICSWMHSVADRRLPWGDNLSVDGRFEHVVAYVRHPLDALGSIMLENSLADSYAFRRRHIQRELGRDINAGATGLERAVLSYLCWMEIVERREPEVVFRVEDGVEPMRQWIASNFPGVAQVAVADEDAGAAPINSSATKFKRAKPRVSGQDLEALPASLLAELKTFCQRYGYELER